MVMFGRKLDTFQKLKDFGKHNALDNKSITTEAMENLALRLSQQFNDSQIDLMLETLGNTWRYKKYPMFGDFMEAHKEPVRNKTYIPEGQQNDYQSWQIEYARKLQIPVESLPADARQLTREQRQKLDLLEPEEIDGLMKNLKWLAGEFKSRNVAGIREILNSESFRQLRRWRKYA